MAPEPERRRALIEALREAARTLGSLSREIEEIREEIIGTVEEATGLPLRPETIRLRSLYDLSPPPQPSLEELRRMVANSLGLEDPDRLEEWLREGLGAPGPGPKHGGGRGGEEAPRGSDETRREEAGEMPRKGG